MVTRRFEGKVALITGAARGMGKEVARDLAGEGAKSVVCDIDGKALDITVNEIRALNPDILGLKCDIASEEQVKNLIDTAINRFGRLDILINNAGILIPGTIEETTNKIIEDTLAVNVKGILYAIRRIAPVMKAQNYGKIVNVASITGKRGDNSTVFVYGASKGAVISLTRSVARELGPFGINCNAVAPHAIMTEMMSYWDDDKKKKIADTIPLKRLGTVRDVANLILFLASDQASFITGETVNINGGYYMD